MPDKLKITDFTEEELKAWAIAQGEKGFRSTQIFQWLYLRGVFDWDQMTNISKKFRQKLSESFSLDRIAVVDRQTADDGTVKLLQKLNDGYRIESVLLRHDDHFTTCISTQVGCAMGCGFCLTASMGFKRHLSAGEIVDQVLTAQSLMPKGKKIKNVVYMGMGEPFHNYDNTVKSLAILLNVHGLNFSSRRITVSTCGLTRGIAAFGREKEVKANLAISLNAPAQEVRRKLMPIGKRYPLDSLMRACREFPQDFRKRITFEYVMFKNINDSLKSARQLVRVLHGIKSKVNLIPFNEHPKLPYQSPDPKDVRLFQQYLLDHGLVATLRISRGQSILAACGQLAARDNVERRLENVDQANPE